MRSDVSRSMISLIERGEASATAVVPEGGAHDNVIQRQVWVLEGAMELMMAHPAVRRVNTPGDAQLAGLVEVVLDGVQGGASVGFMYPLLRERALAFWRGVVERAASGGRALLVAEDGAGAIVGTVQVVLALPDNQPRKKARRCWCWTHRQRRCRAAL
jgi:hypothetical protein